MTSVICVIARWRLLKERRVRLWLGFMEHAAVWFRRLMMGSINCAAIKFAL